MSEKLNYKTRGVKDRQVLMLIIGTFLTLFFGAFVVLSFSGSMFVLFLVEISCVFYLNYYFRSYYDMTIEGNVVTLENVWGRRIYSLKEFKSIGLNHFAFPYPLNPYLRIVFKDVSYVIIKIQNPLKVYGSKGGIKAFVADLADAFRTQMNERY